jgi:hypothetical protein
MMGMITNATPDHFNAAKQILVALNSPENLHEAHTALDAKAKAASELQAAATMAQAAAQAERQQVDGYVKGRIAECEAEILQRRARFEQEVAANDLPGQVASLERARTALAAERTALAQEKKLFGERVAKFHAATRDAEAT